MKIIVLVQGHQTLPSTKNELEGGHALAKLSADPTERLLVAASPPYPNYTTMGWNIATAGAL